MFIEKDNMLIYKLRAVGYLSVSRTGIMVVGKRPRKSTDQFLKRISVSYKILLI